MGFEKLKKKVKRALYLSYDGLTDPLGQSQILPYIIGLSQKGIEFDVISFEKQKPFKILKDKIHDLCSLNGITWHPQIYTKKPAVLSTLFDLYKLKRVVKRITNEKRVDIIHVRSYLPMFSALKVKRKKNTPVLFDMRGFWADERIEGGIWNLNTIIYKQIYTYFKKKEKSFFQDSTHVVSLTNKAKKIIGDQYLEGSEINKISVIPCCADFNHFTQKKKASSEKMKDELNFSSEDYIICYLGSLGTWYMLEEMMLFFSELHKLDERFKILFLTSHQPSEILTFCQKYGIPQDIVRIKFGQRDELDELLNSADYGIFFIKPSFSKQASSPTKMAEMLAKGIPLIANSGVGDVADLMLKNNFGFICDMNNLADKADKFYTEQFPLKIDASEIRSAARKQLSLELAIQKYFEIYKKSY